MNSRSNPFFQASTLPYQAPPFDQIAEEDFLPALLAGIEEKRQEVQAIAQNPDPVHKARIWSQTGVLQLPLKKRKRKLCLWQLIKKS